MKQLRMTRHQVVRARYLAATALCAVVLAAGTAPVSAPAAELPMREGAQYDANGVRFVPLGIGKSYVVDLPRDAKDVLVADPRVANAVVRSARRAFIIGAAVGQTNIFFFDAEGRQIAGFDIAVTRDLNGIRAALKQAIPNGEIRVEGLGVEGIMLTGTVANAAESQQAYDIATRLLNVGSSQTVSQGAKVVNAINIRGRDQVMLKVTVAEVQREVLKQFGVNISGSVGFGNSVVSFNNTNPFPVNDGPISPSQLTGGWVSGNNSVNATLRAMERAGVVRTLAEPNLTAISGETANFLVGGEFPVITGVSCDPPGSNQCTARVEFKKFGVTLNFLPVVLSEGRISLKVMTEVSELSSEGAIVQNNISIPALRVRRADTTVEIPSGGALAMAGMIQEQTRQAMHGLPGLQQVPILGALFRSRDYVNRQTELMVIVTPYIVRAVAPRELSRPDDGFADPSDPTSIFLGKLNRVYGPPGKGDPRRPYHGSYGFILD
jgi:pilus assembly protein CpaC